MFDFVLEKFDRILCRYFGFNEEELEAPKSISFQGNKILVHKNHLYLRYRYSEPINKNIFDEKLSMSVNRKLSQVIGDQFANNLTISLEKVVIKKCQ